MGIGVLAEDKYGIVYVVVVTSSCNIVHRIHHSLKAGPFSMASQQQSAAMPNCKPRSLAGLMEIMLFSHAAVLSCMQQLDGCPACASHGSHYTSSRITHTHTWVLPDLQVAEQEQWVTATAG